MGSRVDRASDGRKSSANGAIMPDTVAMLDD